MMQPLPLDNIPLAAPVAMGGGNVQPMQMGGGAPPRQRDLTPAENAAADEVRRLGWLLLLVGFGSQLNGAWWITASALDLLLILITASMAIHHTSATARKRIFGQKGIGCCCNISCCGARAVYGMAIATVSVCVCGCVCVCVCERETREERVQVEAA
jgi:hypothetical protein